MTPRGGNALASVIGCPCVAVILLILVPKPWAMGYAVVTESMTVTIAGRPAPVAPTSAHLAYLVAVKIGEST
jgi:hypothetical protein